MNKHYAVILTACFLVIGFTGVVAQSILPPAELELKIKEAMHDSDVVKLLLTQVRGLSGSIQNNAEAVKLNNRAIVFAEKSNYLPGLVESYSNAVRFANQNMDITAERIYKQKLDKAQAALDKIEKQKLKLLENENKEKESQLVTAGEEIKTKELVIDEKNRIISGKDTVINRVTLEKQQQEQLLKLSKQEGEIKDLTLKEQQQATRFLFVVSLGIVVILIILLFLFFNSRKYACRIASEKERSDELLKNILPVSVAEELKENGIVKSRYYDNVTVVFTDFEGFTKLSEKMTAEELVKEIDHCYKQFDSIVEKHGLEKIKTIGDAYMCAAGLPEPTKDHAQRAVKAAKEIVIFIDELKKERIAKGMPHFNIRVGLHTGPVVAGVVGTRKFAYDIWGDTVNVAARLESASESGRVNISHSVYVLVKDDFTTSHRGKVMAKNKGEIDMYFVE